MAREVETLPTRYAPSMTPVRSVSPIALCGFLGASVSLWSDASHIDPHRFGTPDRLASSGASLRDRWPAPWSSSLDAALAGERPVLVYARLDTRECVELESRMGADELVAERLAALTIVAVDASSGRLPEASGVALHAAPLFLVLDGSGELVDALEPTTGARFEPFGLAEELARVAAGGPGLAALRAGEDSIALVDRLECAGRFVEAERVRVAALGTESRTNGPLHREDRLRAAILAHRTEPSGASDTEGAIEAQLYLEDDDAMLFRGWTFLASTFASYVDWSAEAPFRGVPRERWQRRLRDATRRGWRGAPDATLDAYGALLTERYAESPDDLDSADRLFCRAVLRTVDKRGGPRAVATRAAVARLSTRR